MLHYSTLHHVRDSARYMPNTSWRGAGLRRSTLCATAGLLLGKQPVSAQPAQKHPPDFPRSNRPVRKVRKRVPGNETRASRITPRIRPPCRRLHRRQCLTVRAMRKTGLRGREAGIVHVPFATPHASKEAIHSSFRRRSIHQPLCPNPRPTDRFLAWPESPDETPGRYFPPP